MFSLLESKEEIARAQQKLEATIRRDFKNKAIKNIGHPGRRILEAEVETDNKYWFRSGDAAGAGEPNPRRLNWFGLLKEAADLQITVEINSPYEARNDQIAGFFGRDHDTGTIYLFHSGRVGGGTKGVGKSRFLTWALERSNLRLSDVVDSGGNIREGILSHADRRQGGNAIRHPVHRHNCSFQGSGASRRNQDSGVSAQTEGVDDFYSESRGQRKGKRASDIDYLSRHGDVVDAVRAWRTSRPLDKEARLVKNVLFDLGVARGEELIEVYEIKTSAARSLVYSAIGQLMVHGTPNQCRRVIVLPDRQLIAPDLKDALKRLEIQLLTFKLDEAKATIV